MESGVRGESFNYYKDNLAISLKAFETEEGKRIAQTYGRKETSGAAVPEANQIVLANYAYGYQYDTGKNFRNTGKNDGWNFRGRGLLQITGRSNYEAIQKRIDKFASDENVNIFKKYDSPNKAISIDEGYMSVAEGTCFPSVAHVNGKSIDTLYIDRANQTEFITAMNKFGFNDQITGNDGTHTYKGTKNKSDHNDHLHSGFDESKIKLIKQ